MKIVIQILLFVFLFTAVNIYAQQQGLYKIVFEADKEGKPISGNLEELHRYVHEGNPIRVGWELTFKYPPPIDTTLILGHWADAGFISTLEGHVFAQINSIYAQGTKTPEPKMLPAVFLNNGEPDGWVALIGTTGVMRQKFKPNPELMKALKEHMNEEQLAAYLKKQEIRKVKTKWAVMLN